MIVNDRKAGRPVWPALCVDSIVCEGREGKTNMTVFLAGLAAFIGGALVSWGNYRLLLLLLKKRGESGISLISPVRTLLSVAYLLILYLIGKRTQLNPTALLIGGALGLTVMLTFFTYRLTRRKNDDGKEGSDHG